jgi:hypothetical protein
MINTYTNVAVRRLHHERLREEAYQRRTSIAKLIGEYADSLTKKTKRTPVRVSTSK